MSVTHKRNNYIEDFSPYMLTNKNLVKCITYNLKSEKKNIKKQTINYEKKHPTMFIPSQIDKLFWIFYVMVKGFDDYNLYQYTSRFSEEKKIKFEYIEKIRKNKALIRSFKIQKIQDCESDLANETQISLKTFHVLCIIENISFIYFTKNTFFEFISNNKQPEHVLHKINDYNAYELNKQDLIPLYKEKRYQITNYEKPLKSISSFTSIELIEIAKFFKLELLKNEKKKTKQDLYTEIYEIMCK